MAEAGASASGRASCPCFPLTFVKESPSAAAVLWRGMGPPKHGGPFNQGGLCMKKWQLMAAVLATGLSGSAFADPAPNPNSNQSCVAQATLAYKVANGPSSTGPAVSEQAHAGTRGSSV